MESQRPIEQQPQIAMVPVGASKMQPQKPPPPPLTAGSQSYTSTSAAPAAKRPANNPWTPAEDKKLMDIVEAIPDAAKISWNRLALQLGTRSGKQCRERYYNSLKPDIKKGKWTQSEDSKIKYLQETLGNQWSRIAAQMPGRSDNDVKNRWHQINKSKQKRKEARMRGNGDSAKQPASKRPKQSHSISSSNAMPTPKVGQRVMVKFHGGKSHGATITKVAQQTFTRFPSYNMTVCYDDGVSEETVFPDPDIQLLPTETKLISNPTKTTLTSNEVKLSHNLLSFSSASKVSHKSEAQNQPAEEEYHEDYLFEYLATLKRQRDNNCGHSSAPAKRTHNIGRITSPVKRFSASGRRSAPVKRTKDSGRRTSAVKKNQEIRRRTAAVATPDSKNAYAPSGEFDSPQDWSWNDGPNKGSAEKKDSDGESTESSLAESSLDSPKAHGNWPLTGIKRPGNNDCIFGRGGGTNYHPGNLKYRKLADDIKPRYTAASRTEKANISMQMVKDWRTKQDPPGRFLKLNEETGLWDDVGDVEARVKCAQGLRERKSSKLTKDPTIYLSKKLPDEPGY